MTNHFPDPEHWEPGIYFGLPDELYHRIPWLGSTDIKELFSNPPGYWWNSPMNPVRPADDDTPSKRFGSALHHCVLYGREAFDGRYRKVPGDSDDVSAEPLKRYILEQGGRPRATKNENIRMMWEEWRKVPISERRYAEVVIADQMVKKNPHLLAAFTGGMPELSIFYHDENGIPMKARIDYNKPRAAVDLKSFASRGRIVPFDRMVLSDILRFRYDIQAAHYLEARRQAIAMVSAGQWFGEADVVLAKKTLSTEAPAFVFVFYLTDGPPIAKSYQIPFGSAMHQSGRTGRDMAVTNYIRCREKFGTDFWVNDDEPYTIDEEDLPAWL